MTKELKDREMKIRDSIDQSLVRPGSFVEDALSVFDSPKFASIAVENSAKFRGASAFPHISFQNFLPGNLAQEARRVFPGVDEIPWYSSEHDNAKKRYQFEDVYMPPLLRAINSAFTSSRFVLFLEELTGIESLIPDPHMVGGGMHLVGPGGLLKMHADFNWYHKLQLHRRVNALWYLSDDWDEAWGGALEFWDVDTRSEVGRAYPHFNSLAVFATGTRSLHGQPEPLACPEGKFRRALNFYYYTAAPVPGDEVDPHWTQYIDDQNSDNNTVRASNPYAVAASPFAASLRKRFLKGVTEE